MLKLVSKPLLLPRRHIHMIHKDILLCNSPKNSDMDMKNINASAMNRQYLTRAVIRFCFELANAIRFTFFIIFTIVNAACKALAIYIQAIIPVFILSNILKIQIMNCFKPYHLKKSNTALYSQHIHK